MELESFDEEEFFRALQDGGARVLLIDRRALVALGAPVLTSDYDLWVHGDDVERLDHALAALELKPNRSPGEARERGRYASQGPVHVDVLVARAVATKDGVLLAFDEAWARRQRVSYTTAVAISIPCIDDLILTKRWSMRERDLPDIRFLEKLRGGEGREP